MATTVGVRNLRDQATLLVRRAAAGERIVITRYGRPHALLGPVADAPAPARGRHASLMRAWRKERDAFERLLPRLLRRHAGRYVAIRGGRVIAVEADHDRLFERVWKRVGGATFFIGLVAAEPPTVDMPGFDLE